MQRGAFLIPGLATVVLATVLVAEQITRPPKLDNRVHVSYWEKWNGFEFDAIKAVVDKFNKSQDRITVDILSISNIENKTTLAVSGGVPPDLAGLYGYNIPQYVDNNAIMPLDDMAREAGIKKEQYVPIYWDACFYQNKLVALPTAPAANALHYNVDMMIKAGLDPQKPPQTIEELDAMADKLTQKSGKKIKVAGFMPGEPGWWNWSWVYYFGGSLWDGKDKITADSKENIAAFKWIRSYSDRLGPTALQSFRSGFGNFASPQNGFMDEEVAMEIQGVWMYNFINQYKPKLKWAAAPFPSIASRPDLKNTTVGEEDVIVIPRGAEHPKEAFEFIKFLQSQKGMELLCMGQRKNSPLVDVSPEFIKNHPNPYIKLFSDLPRSKNAIRTPPIGIWQEYMTELNTAFDEVTLETKTPEQALHDVQTRIQPKLTEYNRLLKMRQAQ